MLPRPRSLSFALTIVAALIVKVLILMLMHKAFFSAPQVRKMRMPTENVERHLLGAPPASPLPSKARP